MEISSQSPLSEPETHGSRRVLLFVHWLAHAGMEQQTINLARAYAALGDEVTICYAQHNTDGDPLVEAGIKLIDLNMTGGLAKMASLPRLVRIARQADIVHCTGWDATAWGRLAGWLARRPVVVTEHTGPGRETQNRKWLVSLHYRLLDPVTAATVVVAEAQIERLERDGVKRSKIHLIPNGIALESIRDAARYGVTRETLGIPEDAKVMIHIGRFIPQKRQDWTYEAAAQLREAGVGDIHVIFAGEGPNVEALKRRAQKDSAHWAHFLGLRRDIPALLALSDLAVLPSETEALPMVMIEALAIGVPQVASDVGDVRAVLEESGAGLVVGRHDKQAYIEACRRVLDDPQLAESQRAAAVTVAQGFDVETMARRYETLFDQVMADRAARRSSRPWR